MPENDAKLINKVAAREADLIAIYQDIYPIMKQAPQADLPQSIVAALQNLDPPETIDPSKAAAILKSIKGSTPDDKFQFEHLFGVETPSGKLLGEVVGERLSAIGLGYHDFWPYLRDRGWLKER